MYDTELGWTLYLEDLERQAVRLRKRPAPPAGPGRRGAGPALTDLLGRMRALAARWRGRGIGPDGVENRG